MNNNIDLNLMELSWDIKHQGLKIKHNKWVEFNPIVDNFVYDLPYK